MDLDAAVLRIIIRDSSAQDRSTMFLERSLAPLKFHPICHQMTSAFEIIIQNTVYLQAKGTQRGQNMEILCGIATARLTELFLHHPEAYFLGWIS